ncbi:MAG TPA: hypothetical protein VHE35_11140 [Kofleriaceae bacterium]|nr:hypothetical protein [Kofleriaceae bacterium]
MSTRSIPLDSPGFLGLLGAAGVRAGLVLAMAAGAGAGLGACSDDTERVPADVPRVTATAACVPLAAGARVLGVSSEGELWLADASGATTVVDATGAMRGDVARADDASVVIPWSQASAALVVDGELWTVEPDGREFLATPPELGRIGQLCGDPTAERGAFVDTDDGLFERLGGFWWRWTQAGGESFGTARQLVRNDGSCVGTDDVLWLVDTDGQLWQISADDARVVAGGGPDAITEAAAAGDQGAAARIGDRLVLGPPWHDVDFAAGAPGHLAGGGGGLWVQVGADVYQRTGGAWRIVDGMAPGAVAIHPHAAGGAWFEYADQVCHATLEEPIVIHGLEPYEHRVAATADLTITSGDAAVTVLRDGAAVQTLDGAGEHSLAGFDLGPPGWHELTVRAAGGATRGLDYDVVDLPARSWATDIQPIYAASCTGYACHGPMPGGTQVDLSTYDAWRTRAARIRERLVRGEMPPVPPRLASATVAIVLEWIEGGMKP